MVKSPKWSSGAFQHLEVWKRRRSHERTLRRSGQGSRRKVREYGDMEAFQEGDSEWLTMPNAGERPNKIEN